MSVETTLEEYFSDWSPETPTGKLVASMLLRLPAGLHEAEVNEDDLDTGFGEMLQLVSNWYEGQREADAGLEPDHLQLATEAARWIHTEVARVEASCRVHAPDGDLSLTGEEFRVLPYANDAVFVGALIAAGDKAPAKELASVRRISIRSAQGRIARARKMGMLSPVPHGAIGGRAMDEAVRITATARAIENWWSRGNKL